MIKKGLENGHQGSKLSLIGFRDVVYWKACLDSEGAGDGVAGPARAVIGEALALEVPRPLQLALQDLAKKSQLNKWSLSE